MNKRQLINQLEQELKDARDTIILHVQTSKDPILRSLADKADYLEHLIAEVKSLKVGAEDE